MTSLARAVSSLPESELSHMVSSLVHNQVAGLVHGTLHGSNTVKEAKEKLEQIRNLEIVQLLPSVEKQKVNEICDKTLEIIELMPQN